MEGVNVEEVGAARGFVFVFWWAVDSAHPFYLGGPFTEPFEAAEEYAYSVFEAGELLPPKEPVKGAMLIQDENEDIILMVWVEGEEE